jgi:sodium transport system permease protein
VLLKKKTNMFMNHFFILLKKELLYVVRDRKTFVTTILISFLLTPILLWGVTQLGNVAKNDFQGKEKIVGVVGAKEGFGEYIQSELKQNYKYVNLNQNEIEQSLKNGDIQASIETVKIDNKYLLAVKYDQRSNLSEYTSNQISKAFETYKAQRIEKNLAEKSLNLAQIDDTQLVAAPIKIEGVADPLLSFFIPYLLILGLVQGGMQYAMETTSGEKERQTLATTLSSGVSSSVIGFAKISGVIVFSLLTTMLNVLSIYLAFKFIPGVAGEGVDLAGFGLDKIAQLMVVAIPLSLLISTAMVALGLYARNLKEGYSYAMPILLVSIFAAVSANFFDSNTPLFFFAIPVIGQIVAIKQIVFGSLSAVSLGLLTLVTVIIFGVLFYITTRLFDKEEVIFRV